MVEVDRAIPAAASGPTEVAWLEKVLAASEDAIEACSSAGDLVAGQRAAAARSRAERRLRELREADKAETLAASATACETAMAAALEARRAAPGSDELQALRRLAMVHNTARKVLGACGAAGNESFAEAASHAREQLRLRCAAAGLVESDETIECSRVARRSSR